MRLFLCWLFHAPRHWSTVGEHEFFCGKCKLYRPDIIVF